MQEIFIVTPRLQLDDSGETVELSSLSPHGGVLFKKWFKIFKTEVIDGLKLGQNIHVRIVAKNTPLGFRPGPDGKYRMTDYVKQAWVYLPKNPTQETRELVKSYIMSVDDDGNYPIQYRGRTYLASASAAGASLVDISQRKKSYTKDKSYYMY